MESNGKWHVNICCGKSGAAANTFKAYFELDDPAARTFKQACPHCHMETTLSVKPKSDLSYAEHAERMKRTLLKSVAIFAASLLLLLIWFLAAPSIINSILLWVSIFVFMLYIGVVLFLNKYRDDYARTAADNETVELALMADGSHMMKSNNPKTRYKRVWKGLPKQGEVN
jgi:hypothetical protein